jgi:Tfp pilus assembly protein PilN
MAVKDINLIPADILTRRYVLRHVCFWTGCLILSLSLIGIGTLLFNHAYLPSKHAAIAAMRNAPLTLNTKAEEIRQIQTELSNLNKRKSALQFIVTRNPSYAAVITKLADIMNEDTWLTQLNLDSEPGVEGKTHLKLSGFSFSNAKLGDFLNRLASETMFTGVELKYSKERDQTSPGQKGDQSSGGQSGGHSERAIQYQIDCYISKDNRG